MFAHRPAVTGSLTRVLRARRLSLRVTSSPDPVLKLHLMIRTLNVIQTRPSRALWRPVLPGALLMWFPHCPPPPRSTCEASLMNSETVWRWMIRGTYPS